MPTGVLKCPELAARIDRALNRGHRQLMTTGWRRGRRLSFMGS